MFFGGAACRYSGTVGPNGVTVAAGTTITWSSDASIANTGFTVCGVDLSRQLFTVTSAVPTSACYVTSGGTCVTDGVGNHGNNERCSISVLHNTFVSTTYFSTEGGFDHLTVGSVA